MLVEVVEVVMEKEEAEPTRKVEAANLRRITEGDLELCPAVFRRE
jgi:hypothetical protein